MQFAKRRSISEQIRILPELLKEFCGFYPFAIREGCSMICQGIPPETVEVALGVQPNLMGSRSEEAGRPQFSIPSSFIPSTYSGSSLD